VQSGIRILPKLQNVGFVEQLEEKTQCAPPHGSEAFGGGAGAGPGGGAPHGSQLCGLLMSVQLLVAFFGGGKHHGIACGKHHGIACAAPWPISMIIHESAPPPPRGGVA